MGLQRHHRDLELANETVNFTLTGSTRTGGKWGVGPYDVMAQDAAGTPGPMLTPLGSTCYRRTGLSCPATVRPCRKAGLDSYSFPTRAQSTGGWIP
ncbi:hypothetical protein [Streptomyces sp. NPDC048473]|uniref:hypothetical protein n=1 Tax=unclassified Streptomyces TaxID=2593676 RepID=UPI0037194C08